MIKKYCDRCGREAPLYGHAHVDVDFDYRELVDKIDLCHSCWTLLNTIIAKFMLDRGMTDDSWEKVISDWGGSIDNWLYGLVKEKNPHG